jgi:Domain of unknown function (DUF5658)
LKWKACAARILHFIGYLRDSSTDLARDSIDTAADIGFDTERRLARERRALSWRTFFFGSLTPRRRGNRRGEAVDGLLDWHEPHLLFLAIMILLMSVTDAFLTLTLINEGANEANPIMAFLLERTPRLFITAKMLLTGGGIVVLVALARARVFRVIRISIIIHWFMLGYVALLAYEAWLLRQIV